MTHVNLVGMNSEPREVFFTSLHIQCQGTGTTSSFVVGHFGYFYSFGNSTCCSEVLNSPSKVGTNNGKYIKTSPLSFLRVKVLTDLAIEKERKCYSFCIFSTLFQTPRKKNRLCNPPPLRKFIVFRPPYPSEFP